MFTKRTPQQILNNGLDLLVENTPINNLTAGAIARTIIESFAYEMGSNTINASNLYDIAEYVLRNAFLSSADETHLDLIGVLLDYPRREVEVYDGVANMTYTQLIDDETYRYELSRRIHTIASSNEEALRMALLALDGIKNVIGEEYTHGTGSFTFVLIPLAGYSNDMILENAKDVIVKTKAYGIKYDVKVPKEVPVDFNIQLILKESSSSSDYTEAILNARQALTTYFESFEVGQGFIYNDFIQELMNSYEKIIDFKILAFYMNKEPVLLTNQNVAEDERIRPGSIEVV